MPFDYVDIPFEASADDEDIGYSLAFGENFGAFAKMLHTEGYYAGQNALAKVFSVGLMQHFILYQSGIKIGEGREDPPPRKTSPQTASIENSQLFWGEQLKYIAQLEAFIPAKHLVKLKKNRTINRYKSEQNTAPYINTAFAIYAPVLEQMRDCKLLHQLGAELMLIRSFTESRHDNRGDQELVSHLSLEERGDIIVALEQHGQQIKKIIYNIIKFYISEARKHCESLTLEEISSSFPLSEFTVWQVEKMIRVSDPDRIQNILGRLVEVEQPNSDEESKDTKELDDALELLGNGTNSHFILGMGTGKLGRSAKSSVAFCPNELELPEEIMAAINKYYVNGVDSIPDIDLEAVQKIRKPDIQTQSSDFNGPRVLESLKERFALDDNIYDALPNLKTIWPQKKNDYRGAGLTSESISSLDSTSDVVDAPILQELPEQKMQNLIDKFNLIINKITEIENSDAVHKQHKQELNILKRGLIADSEWFSDWWSKEQDHDQLIELTSAFKKKVESRIKSAELNFNKEPGILGQLNPIFKSLLGVILAIVSLGMMPLYMHVAKETGHTQHGFNDVFFKPSLASNAIKESFKQARINQELSVVINEIEHVNKPK